MTDLTAAYRAMLERALVFEASGAQAHLRAEIAKMRLETEQKRQRLVEELRGDLDKERAKPDPNPLLVESFEELLQELRTLADPEGPPGTPEERLDVTTSDA